MDRGRVQKFLQPAWGIGCAILLLPGLLLLACGEDAAAPGSRDGSVFPCETDDDCPRGMACMGNKICSGLTEDDGGDNLEPELELEPDSELEFGAPLIGSEITANLTVRNRGGAPLMINALLLLEDGVDREAGEINEYSLEPVELPLSIAPGSSTVLTVVLRPNDDDQDLGQLAIGCNDRDETNSVVYLTSDLKGDPVLQVCTAPPLGSSEDCADPAVVDFGEVLWGATVEREFRLANDGDGNQPIRLDRLSFMGTPSLFEAELYVMDGDEELPVELPQFLSPAGDFQEANELFVRVSFDASDEDSVLGDANQVHLEWNPESISLPGSTDLVMNERDIPIVAEFLNCAPDRWDVRDDLPGCEYACVFAGEVDVCDGVDNDCDGVSEEDFDRTVCGVGDCAGEASCLGGEPVCGTAAADDATCDGDDDDCDGVTDENYTPYTCGFGACTATSTCVDGIDSCTPTLGSAEICDDVDNDCDGTVDDGCDDDGDGWCDTALTVIAAPAVCSSGVGDCDDTQSAISPADSELCDDTDNNCDGETDEGCNDDGDDYCDAEMTVIGAPAICPEGPGDCDDDNETVSPGETERCNDTDDDCVSGSDNGCDDDDDGYCDAALGFDVESDRCPGGPGDCDDTDPAVGPASPETCDGLDNDCDAAADEGCDDDGDGYCDATMGLSGTSASCPSGGGDCDDSSASITPATAEVCDDVDNNCVSGTDEGCDSDDDNYCNNGMLVIGLPSTCSSGGGDCDDRHSGIHPGAPEICDNLDNNCDGLGVDEGCDDDGDDYCDFAVAIVGLPPVCPLGGGDCNDGDAAISPAAIEVCDDINNNCVAGTDEGCDIDNDNYCSATMTMVGTPSTCTAGGADCNDANSTVNPGASEICDNLSNDCDALIDEGCDDDGDNYCDSTVAVVGPPFPTTCSAGGGDCNDTNAAINPSVAEVCDGSDNNCAFGVDERCDDDNDNFCDSAMTVVGTPPTCTFGGGDCNDSDTAIFPGAVEVCDSANNDCDAAGVDEGCDDDNDNFCDSAMAVVGTAITCTGGGGDCNDTNAAINPATTDVCDDVDNNCTSGVDEGCDDDNDDYCDAAIAMVGAPATCRAGGADCNDAVATIHPGATELCDNVDNNCAGTPSVDEGCDDDNDNYCDSAMAKAPIVVTTCSLTPAAAITGDDCNDANSAIRPTAVEICDDLNNNCFGGTDEGCDDDNDNTCDAAMTVVGPPFPSTCTAGGGDCNDTVATIGPGVAEVCNNANDDCDLATDEGCDDDNDNYCDSTMAKAGGATVTTCTATASAAVVGDDCDDGNLLVRPGATEVCNNVNDDCDASGVDEGCDDDDDNYCDSAMSKTAGVAVATCSATPTSAGAGDDCNDGVPTINPGRTEVCNNVNDDCDGGTDEGCDDDDDNYCDSAMSKAAATTITLCPLTPAASTSGNDCDDSNAAINPAATEICDNANNDCDAVGSDEGCDDDNDDYCDAAMTKAVGITVSTCTGTAAAATAGDDCNDTNNAIRPGATEVCDNVNNDCDTAGADEGCDDDNDDFCDSAMAISGTPTVCPLGGGDCNDSAPAIRPGVAEVCDNIDNNCMAVDEGCDDDNDDYCDSAMSKTAVLVAVCPNTPIGSTVGDDCSDTNSTVSPAGTEICNNLNDDCDAGTDEGCDDDNDGYCDVAMSVVGPPTTCTFGGGDCNDTDVAIRPGATEICDNLDNNCAGTPAIDEGCDDDDDNYCDALRTKIVGVIATCTATPSASIVGDDCDDLRSSVSPGAFEMCDGLNNDCDAVGVDEDCDDDNDNYCDAGMTLVGPPYPPTCTAGGGDCADTVAARNPGVDEICDDIDNNCLGGIDNGCDDDGDDYCDATMAKVAGAAVSACPLTPAAASVGDDCHDGIATVHPGATELCNDTNDDCDTAGTDEGCDDDNDNYCDVGMSRVGSPSTCTAGGGDCADTLAAVNPGAAEICDNVDNNCAGSPAVDEGCDDDGDDYCDSAMGKSAVSVSACPLTPVAATVGDDCNDVASFVHPGATELCNDANDDCDSAGSDEGCDDDNDNYCDTSMSRVGTPSTCTAGGGDCADTVAAINPGATEICDNVDNNCAGSPAIDEGCDDDNDDYCDVAMSKASVVVTTCTTSGSVAAGNDCNDVNSAIHPGATEICNNVDEDCDAVTDEGCDDDDDNYCDATMTKAAGTTVTVCPLTSAAAAVGNDCNDSVFSVNPAGTETCNALDDNCNGTVDDGIAEAASEGANICTGGPVGVAMDYFWSPITLGGVIHTGDEDWYQVTVVDDVDADTGCGDDDEFNLRMCWGSNPGNVLRADLYRGSCAPGGPCVGGACSCTNVDDVAGADARWEYTGDGFCSTDESSDMGGPLWVRIYRPGGAVGCTSYSFTVANGFTTCP